MLAANLDYKNGKSNRMQSQSTLARELQSVSWQSPHLIEHDFWRVHPMCLFIQGSYGVVKLAYNENDNTYYVSTPIASKEKPLSQHSAPSTQLPALSSQHSAPIEVWVFVLPSYS